MWLQSKIGRSLPDMVACWSSWTGPIMPLRCSFYRLLRVVLLQERGGGFQWKAKKVTIQFLGSVEGMKQSSSFSRSRPLEACCRCDGVVFCWFLRQFLAGRVRGDDRLDLLAICRFDLYFDDLFQVVQSGDSHPERVQQHGTNGTDVEGNPAHLHVRTDDHTRRR